MIPRSTMEKDLRSQEKALTEEINTLGKKVTCLLAASEFIESDGAFQVKYLEKQFNDAQSQLRDIVRVYAILLGVFDLKILQFNSAPKQ